MPGALDPLDYPYIAPPVTESQHVDGEEALKGFPEGSQNVGLFKFACSLLAQNVPQAYAEILVGQAAANCTPPYPAEDTYEGPGYISIVKNVYSKYKSNGTKGAEAYDQLLDTFEFPTFDDDESSSSAIPAVPSDGFEFLSVGAWMQSVDESDPPGWLVQRIWPADAYGVLAADNKAGKGSPLNSIVYTPTGRTTLGDLKVGSTVLTPTGQSSVKQIHELGERDIYRITFDDDSSLDTTAEHIWQIQSTTDSSFEGLATTCEILSNKYGPPQKLAIPLTDPVEFIPQDVPLAPYLLGLLLGDGCISQRSVSLATADDYIVEHACDDSDYVLKKYKGRAGRDYYSYGVIPRSKDVSSASRPLRQLNLMGTKSDTKFVPDVYKYNSSSIRLAVLQGLLDTDGWVESRHGQLRFDSTSYQLALDVVWLVQSLGGIATVSCKQRFYTKQDGLRVQGKDCYSVIIKHPNPAELVRLPRKKDICRVKIRRCQRRIKTMEYIGRLQARCITIDDNAGLYLADHFIVTHNSWAISDLAISKAAGMNWMSVQDFICPKPGPVLVFFGEGGRRKMLRRLRAIAAWKGISDDELEHLPITACFKMPHLTNPEHLARTREHLKKVPAELIILDPLYLAARGADGRDLYDMGKHLSAIQEVAQENNAALVVVTHFKKGEDEGFRRITGVGPGAWGRVLGTATVKSISLDSIDTEEGESDVLMHWEFIGDEISETEVNVQRRIWQEGLDDLNSPMHYEIEQVELNPAAEQKLTPAQQRVEQALIRGLTKEPGVSRVINQTTGWLATSEVLLEVLTDGKKAMDGSTLRKYLYTLKKKERLYGPVLEDGTLPNDAHGKSQPLYWKTAVGIGV